MKFKKLTPLFTLLFILLLGVALFFTFSNKKINDILLPKETVLRNFYSSYEKKDLDLYNNSVTEDLKTKNKEDKKVLEALFEDIITFKVIKVKELPNDFTEFNGKTFDKSNIAKFEVFYDVDFNQNITTSEEGKVSTIKILTREDENSPWLVAGQDGHGL